MLFDMSDPVLAHEIGMLIIAAIGVLCTAVLVVPAAYLFALQSEEHRLNEERRQRQREMRDV